MEQHVSSRTFLDYLKHQSVMPFYTIHVSRKLSRLRNIYSDLRSSPPGPSLLAIWLKIGS